MRNTPTKSHDSGYGTLVLVEDHVSWVLCQPEDPEMLERAGGPFVRRMDRWTWNAIPEAAPQEDE